MDLVAQIGCPLRKGGPDFAEVMLRTFEMAADKLLRALPKPVGEQQYPKRGNRDEHHEGVEMKLAARAAEAIRAHWGVETTSHDSRDVTMGEDRSRIRSNPAVFARARSFAFNILKANQTSTLSQDRYRACLAGFDNLFKLFGVR